MKAITEVDASETVSHFLIHLVPDPDYLKFQIKFASPVVQETITERFLQSQYREIINFVKVAEKEMQFGSLRGYLFEQCAHHFLQRGGRFQIRKLGTNHKSWLDVPQQAKSYCQEFKPLVQTTGYCQPYSKIFGAVDSWESGLGFFQMTVSETHEINLVSIGEMQRRAIVDTNGLWKFYFVVPEVLFSSYTRQRPKRPAEEPREKEKGQSKKRKRFSPDDLAEYETNWDNMEQYVLQMKFCD